MNVFSVVNCLQEDGSLTSGEAQDFKGVLKSVSGLQTRDILALMFALQLVKSGNANAFDQTLIGSELLTSADDEDLRTLDPPSGATYAIITISGNNIIYALGDESPGAPSNGNIGPMDTMIRVTDLANFKFISSSGTPATVFVNYF